jgi:hypothetical protein
MRWTLMALLFVLLSYRLDPDEFDKIHLGSKMSRLDTRRKVREEAEARIVDSRSYWARSDLRKAIDDLREDFCNSGQLERLAATNRDELVRDAARDLLRAARTFAFWDDAIL